MANHLFDGLLQNANREHAFAQLDDGRWYTYNHVMEVSARFANMLVRCGLQPGDRVAAQVPKSIEALMLYLGDSSRRRCIPAVEQCLHGQRSGILPRQCKPPPFCLRLRRAGRNLRR